MFPIEKIMGPLAENGLCLHTYPHPDRTDGTWVLKGSTMRGDKSAHIEVDGAFLQEAFPPEGGKFLIERHVNIDDQYVWTLRLLHGDDETVVREFPPNTNVLTALRDFFKMPLMIALLPHLKRLIDSLGYT
jgi:hypothetical protein